MNHSTFVALIGRLEGNFRLSDSTPSGNIISDGYSDAVNCLQWRKFSLSDIVKKNKSSYHAKSFLSPSTRKNSKSSIPSKILDTARRL